MWVKRLKANSASDLSKKMVEEDICALDDVGEVRFMVRHLDNGRLALSAHDGTARSLGKRMRLPPCGMVMVERWPGM